MKRTRLGYVAGCEISLRRLASATPPGMQPLELSRAVVLPFRRGNAYPQSPVGVLRPPGLIKLIPLRPLTCAAPGARRREQPSRPRPRGLAAQLPHRKTRARPPLIRQQRRTGSLGDAQRLALLDLALAPAGRAANRNRALESEGLAAVDAPTLALAETPTLVHLLDQRRAVGTARLFPRASSAVARS